MIHILVAGALLVHGIGHTLGFWKPCRSVPFVKISEPILKIIGDVTWATVALGFILASLSYYGLLLPADWWQPLSFVFAIISLVALLLFGRNWPKFNFVAAAAMDIVILVLLLR